MSTQAAKSKPEASEDEFLWLEDRDSERAKEWVREQNARTVAELQGDPDYQPMFETALKLMTAEDNMAFGAENRGKVYNFWQDAKNALGIWRRTTVDSYKTDKPDWETIIDFDALAAKEGISWVFNGATRLYPDFSRCLLSMSPDGGDAAECANSTSRRKPSSRMAFARRPPNPASPGWTSTRCWSRPPSRTTKRPIPAIRASSNCGSAASRWLTPRRFSRSTSTSSRPAAGVEHEGGKHTSS